MAEEAHRTPLAPATRYGRSDEEHATTTSPSSSPWQTTKKKDETTSKCLVYVLTLIVIASTVSLTFATIFARAESPSMRLTNPAIQNPTYDNTTASAFVSATLTGEIRIKNTNFGKFVYQWATAVVLYRDVVVGNETFHGGRVNGRDSSRVAIAVGVSSVAALDTNMTVRLSNDVNLGVLELTNYANVTGKIHLLNGFIKRRRTIVMNCTVSLNVVTNVVDSLVCN